MMINLLGTHDLKKINGHIKTKDNTHCSIKEAFFPLITLKDEEAFSSF